MKLSLLVFLFVISCSHYFISTSSAQSFTPTFEKSKKSLFKISKDQRYTFGYLEVLENRRNPDSKTIKLPVYIFRSRNPNPKPDPIIYTVGGPGSTTMPSAQYMKYYQYLDDRDFILFEQRGVYYAEPPLNCPEWAEAVHLSNLPDFDPSQSERLLADAAKKCRERLIRKGIDLDGYNTNEIAADIEDLRKTLGINQYNLLTISYSTKIAQVLLRDYPQGIRSVVMDSPLPLEVNYDEESVGNLLEAVKNLLSDCASSAECSEAFPNIRYRFFKYLEEKTANPLVVTIKNPKSGAPETFYLKGKDLITIFTSASTSEVVDVPFEISRLLNNDLTSVKERLSSLFQKPGGGAGLGMRLSVWCAEEYPFSSPETIRRETNQYAELKGLSPAVYDSSICAIWKVSKAPDIENEAVKSEIPVLLISGSYDNETPPKWAANMQKNLPNSFHLIFKGWKHTPTTNWSNPCAMQAANDFFNDPGSKPKPACFEEITIPRFRTE